MPSAFSASRIVRFGVFELDTGTGELRRSGVRTRLAEQPLRVLLLLLERPGELVTREDLRTALWPSNSYLDFDHGLNKAINKLREALGDCADTPRFIETLARRGYRFLGEPAVRSEQIRSLLVLPLENLSGDPEQEYFADGLTEALITRLARIGALRVLSRTTAMAYKRARKPLPQIARELNVEGVVEGTVLRSGGRVRVAAQLLHAPTDTHLWADSYERDLRDIIALQSEVAGSIAREIQVKLTAHEQAQLGHVRAVDPEVYEAYLRGRYFWNKRTLEGMSKGAAYFRAALERDPNYAPAHVGLADSAARLGWWGYVPPQDGNALAKIAAQQALALDPSLADAHAALGFALLHYDFAFDSAVQQSRRAVDLDPRSAFAAQAYSCALLGAARLEGAVEQALRTVQLDPLSLILQWFAATALYLARDYDRALAQSRHCLELDPTFPPARATMAFALAMLPGPETGIEALEEAVEGTAANQFFLGVLGYAYARARRPAPARAVLERLRQSAAQRWVSAFWPAVIHGALGEADDAFRLLQAARDEHAPWVAYLAIAPFVDDLRADARFARLLREIDFPSARTPQS